MPSEPKAPAGGYATIDQKKLGRDGFVMVGEINAMERWARAFAGMREATPDLLERKFLMEIVAALLDDAERIQMELARYAMARGAGKLHDKLELPAPNAPTTEQQQ